MVLLLSKVERPDTRLPGECFGAALSSTITSPIGGDAWGGLGVGRDAVDLAVTAIPTPPPRAPIAEQLGGRRGPEEATEMLMADRMMRVASARLPACFFFFSSIQFNKSLQTKIPVQWCLVELCFWPKPLYE